MLPKQIMFLPGAIGDPLFWQPVADLIEPNIPKQLLGWPGFGNIPKDKNVNCFEDLLARTINDIDQSTMLVAQSMGGIIAMIATLKKPELITHLVLTVTSGGIDLSDIQIANWKEDYLNNNPTFPDWFATINYNLTDQLSAVKCPVLLIWGDCDPISPVAVADKLKGLLPQAQLQIIKGGAHNLANAEPEQVASLINQFLV